MQYEARIKVSVKSMDKESLIKPVAVELHFVSDGFIDGERLVEDITAWFDPDTAFRFGHIR